MNPCTLQLYLPLLLKDIPHDQRLPEQRTLDSDTTQQHTALRRGSEPWHELDARFRHSMPEKQYVKRMAYRGLLLRYCSKLQVLDGVMMTEKEKRRVLGVLKSLES